MKKAILFFIVALHFHAFAQDYTPVERYNDSVLIYNHYQALLEFLKIAKETETDIIKWYKLEAEADRSTACAKIRLAKFNHEPYTPINFYEKQNIGATPLYPRPGTTQKELPPQAGVTLPNRAKQGYRLIDKQTHFLIDSITGRRTPYIRQFWFQVNKEMDKLDPVTGKVLVL